MNAVLVVPEVSLGVVACPESAEDADLASSPGAEGVRGERGEQRVDREGRQRRLQTHKIYISFCKKIKDWEKGMIEESNFFV